MAIELPMIIGELGPKYIVREMESADQMHVASGLRSIINITEQENSEVVTTDFALSVAESNVNIIEDPSLTNSADSSCGGGGMESVLITFIT